LGGGRLQVYRDPRDDDDLSRIVLERSARIA